ncbi:hypothetical protein MTY66_44840 [Mycolicibacterium sp. TY66]|uniref:DUF2628 domain-containing protein n=1 Tax=unclassified Mycolicibacterium TaxID=2636767 RepID=UPI001BB7DE90|nr:MULTISPECIES: DUF2628 domain-containing protein [unclassified Mycolicibacterium]BCI82859.1 hypothetical protein MTY66_44840 [Mycolicibacterium sp. TY66]BCJ79490.1 hypothetical protein MTY81_08630 [Mycolicibacterium sp. TY81]
MSQQLPSITVSPSWQKRFDFFNAYGLPNSTPESKAAYKALTFLERVKLTSNILAFLFGPIYFFVKGMWRKGLTLLGIFVAVEVVLVVLNVSDSLARAIGFGLAAIGMSTANYAYYLHVVRGSQSWNLFEGHGRQR